MNKQVLQLWLERIANAMAVINGLKLEFHTSYQSGQDNVDDEAYPFHAHKGQMAKVVDLFIDPEKCEYDEEALPYYSITFDDGVKLVGGSEELFSHDPRWHELRNAVSSGFGISRAMGFVGPTHFSESATDEQKAMFNALIPLFFDAVNEQNFCTPEAYRSAERKIDADDLVAQFVPILSAA